MRGLVANPGRRLKAEMLGTARVLHDLGTGVLVPAKAVSLEGTVQGVMVEVAPGAFERREVEVGYQGKNQVLITEGLTPGEKVVGENMLLLARQYRSAMDAARPAARAASAQPAASGRKP